MTTDTASTTADPEENPGRLGLWLLALLILAPIAINAIALLPELTSRAPSLNDDAFQYLLVQRASDALATSRNPLDFWSPTLELGFPQFFYYQHLPHLIVVFLNRALFGSVDLLTSFNLVRYVLLVGFPLTVFWSMRRMGFSLVAAAVAAAASSLLAGNDRYGFEYDSYIWRGLGMFTQLWAMHLSFIALACVIRVLQRGTGYLPAILALAALGLSHLIYAYMMAITLVIALIVGVAMSGRRKTLLPTVVRLAIVGVTALAVSAYMWLPFLSSRQYLSASPYLQPWKYDSFGAPTIMGWLTSGDLLDHGRLPVLTGLLGLGIVAAVLRRTSLNVLVLSGFVVWLILYFGRPTLGPIANLFPMQDGLLFHRFIGEMELFAIILMGIGGALVWRLAARLRLRWHPVLAFVALALVLAPAVVERAGYYADSSRWMAETRTALDQDTDLQAIVATLRTRPGGRTYAGLRTNWGNDMKVGPYIKVTDMLTFYGIPAVSPPYQSLSLNSDLMWHFRDGEASQYDLFDVRYVIVPSNFTVPAFYRPLQRTGRYALYEIPTSGMAEFVAVTDRRSAPTQRALFDSNLSWFQGTDPAARRFIRWDYLSPVGAPESSAGCPSGASIPYERDEPDAIHLVVECPNAATLAFKVTYHPNWQVTVDGQRVDTFMVSPSFVGVNLPGGRHSVNAIYVASPQKLPLAGLGLIVLALLAIGRRELDLLPRRLERADPPPVKPALEPRGPPSPSE